MTNSTITFHNERRTYISRSWISFGCRRMDTFTVFGRSELFYYAPRFLVMHVVLMILFFIQGEHTMQEAIDAKTPFLFIMPGEGIQSRYRVCFKGNVGSIPLSRLPQGFVW